VRFEDELRNAFRQHMQNRPPVMYVPRHPVSAYPPAPLAEACGIASKLKSRGFVLLVDPDDGP
jgi:hypothetical protein